MNIFFGMLLIILSVITFVVTLYNADIIDGEIWILFLISAWIVSALLTSAYLLGSSIKESASPIEPEIKTECNSQEEISASFNKSDIKVALIQNYPEAEIISNENDLQHGIFIYNNENYSFEVEDNILFIKQDKKLVKYIYLN